MSVGGSASGIDCAVSCLCVPCASDCARARCRAPSVPSFGQRGAQACVTAPSPAGSLAGAAAGVEAVPTPMPCRSLPPEVEARQKQAQKGTDIFFFFFFYWFSDVKCNIFEQEKTNRKTIIKLTVGLGSKRAKKASRSK